MKHSSGRDHGGNGILRAVLVALSVLLQVGWILLLVLRLNRYSTLIYLASSLLSLVAVLRLYSREGNAAYKMPWIMVIMAFPVMGLSLYLMAQLTGTGKWMRRRVQALRRAAAPYLAGQGADPETLRAQCPREAGQLHYLQQHTGHPAWANTSAEYYGEAVQALERMKQDLEQAERFIFMEYFIVEDRAAFQSIQEILVRKAAQGVTVRLMYDDVGSIGYVNLKFARKLNALGIQCRAFNPALPFLNLFMNHRDHRKITVIDGRVGYTGGYNLANEYFGITHPFGHWKDTGLRLEGEAVRSLTATFLELWNLNSPQPEDVAPWLDIRHSVEAEGFVQPFGDDPLGAERVAENVYMNLVGGAREYVWFISPYLLITDELSRALGLAAKRGVDVRILTPGIPDKPAVYQLTRSYYGALVGQGVRIFEYTPGFCHAKQCLCDGHIASIGTSNLDYRSLYLHYENDVLLCGGPALARMEADFRETFAISREVTDRYRGGPSRFLRLWQCILRLFAPMM